MTDRSNINLSDLPDWARSALEESSTMQSAESTESFESTLTYRDGAAWPLLMDAAVVNAFLPQELAPSTVKSEERSEAERIVLNFAETTRTAEGGLKWLLKEDARTEVIKASINTEELQQAIERTSNSFTDARSEALRYCLRVGGNLTLSSDLNSLQNTRIALNSLSGVLDTLPNGSTLNIKTIDREIDRRRLLSVFERMIGRRRDPGGTETTERFYGRDREITLLRDYVGVIPAEDLRGQFRRGLRWLSNKISGRAPLVIWGVGGVGKTTLISKFMLEHAEAAKGRYPFAYLDFDRNTISARRLSGLLMEMCQQVGAQFDKLTEPMAELRAKIAVVARTFDISRDSESTSYIASHAQEFRDLVDEFLHNEEQTFEFARPFLLVFDTFEVVQYAEDDIANLQDFVASFSKPGENRLWNRLRLIISGRKEVKVFLVEVEIRELGALDEPGSVAMLMALAGDGGKLVSEQEAQALVKAIVQLTNEKTGGVQPLRLKLIGNLFEKDEEHTGSVIVNSLIEELDKPLESGGLAASILIDGILVRRVLGHIRDARVRALADPGLVVRRITPEVIKEVMAAATTDPSQNEPEGVDTPPSPPWKVDELESLRIFDEFGNEGTLVEQDDQFPIAGQGIVALRHRADVRRQMLPLIRARRPNRFRLMHQLAFDHFSEEVEEKKKEKRNEMPAAAEAIYHGLYLDLPLEQIDALWPNETGFDPRIDDEEFGRESRGSIYLRAKANGKLDADEVIMLPINVALNWLSHRSSDLLEERRIESAIYAIQKIAGADYAAIGDDEPTAATLCRLLYRAGRWDEAYELATRYLRDRLPVFSDKSTTGDTRSALLSLFRTAVTIEVKSGVPGEMVQHAFRVAISVNDLHASIELVCHTVLITPDQKSRQDAQKAFSEIMLSQFGLTSFPPWQSEQRILRLDTIASTSFSQLTKWVDYRERIPRDAGKGAIMEMFAKAFRDKETLSILSEMEKALSLDPGSNSGWTLIDNVWRQQKSLIQEALASGDLLPDCWRLMLFEHSDWLRPFGNALTRLFQFPESDALLGVLGKSEFRDQTWRARQLRERDGIGIVQGAADDGRLLELAQILVSERERFGEAQASGTDQNRYPQSVFEIASALLSWHKLLESFPQPKIPSDQAS